MVRGCNETRGKAGAFHIKRGYRQTSDSNFNCSDCKQVRDQFKSKRNSQLENPRLRIFSMIFGGERYNLFYGVAKETSQNGNYRPLRQMHRVA